MSEDERSSEAWLQLFTEAFLRCADENEEKRNASLCNAKEALSALGLSFTKLNELLDTLGGFKSLIPSDNPSYNDREKAGERLSNLFCRIDSADQAEANSALSIFGTHCSKYGVTFQSVLTKLNDEPESASSANASPDEEIQKLIEELTEALKVSNEALAESQATAAKLEEALLWRDDWQEILQGREQKKRFEKPRKNNEGFLTRLGIKRGWWASVHELTKLREDNDRLRTEIVVNLLTERELEQKKRDAERGLILHLETLKNEIKTLSEDKQSLLEEIDKRHKEKEGLKRAISNLEDTICNLTENASKLEENNEKLKLKADEVREQIRKELLDALNDKFNTLEARDKYLKERERTLAEKEASFCKREEGLNELIEAKVARRLLLEERKWAERNIEREAGHITKGEELTKREDRIRKEELDSRQAIENMAADVFETIAQHVRDLSGALGEHHLDEKIFLGTVERISSLLSESSPLWDRVDALQRLGVSPKRGLLGKAFYRMGQMTGFWADPKQTQDDKHALATLLNESRGVLEEIVSRQNQAKEYSAARVQKEADLNGFVKTLSSFREKMKHRVKIVDAWMLEEKKARRFNQEQESLSSSSLIKHDLESLEQRKQSANLELAETEALLRIEQEKLEQKRRDVEQTETELGRRKERLDKMDDFIQETLRSRRQQMEKEFLDREETLTARQRNQDDLERQIRSKALETAKDEVRKEFSTEAEALAKKRQEFAEQEAAFKVVASEAEKRAVFPIEIKLAGLHGYHVFDLLAAFSNPRAADNVFVQISYLDEECNKSDALADHNPIVRSFWDRAVYPILEQFNGNRHVKVSLGDLWQARDSDQKKYAILMNCYGHKADLISFLHKPLATCLRRIGVHAKNMENFFGTPSIKGFGFPCSGEEEAYTYRPLRELDVAPFIEAVENHKPMRSIENIGHTSSILYVKR